jgi:hypothetical protein
MPSRVLPDVKTEKTGWSPPDDHPPDLEVKLIKNSTPCKVARRPKIGKRSFALNIYPLGGALEALGPKGATDPTVLRKSLICMIMRIETAVFKAASEPSGNAFRHPEDRVPRKISWEKTGFKLSIRILSISHLFDINHTLYKKGYFQYISLQITHTLSTPNSVENQSPGFTSQLLYDIFTPDRKRR